MKTQLFEYYIYFDILQLPLSDIDPELFFWFVPGSALIVTVAAFFLRVKWLPALLFLIFTIFVAWCGAYLAKKNYLETKELRAMLSKGLAEVVEGKIEHFKPLPPSRRGYESFEVKGVAFQYKDDQENKGFARSRLYGKSILDEGMQVRIHYFGNNILRIEIARNP